MNVILKRHIASAKRSSSLVFYRFPIARGMHQPNTPLRSTGIFMQRPTYPMMLHSSILKSSESDMCIRFSFEESNDITDTLYCALRRSLDNQE